jgi:hypothetical protein
MIYHSVRKVNKEFNDNDLISDYKSNNLKTVGGRIGKDFDNEELNQMNNTYFNFIIN